MIKTLLSAVILVLLLGSTGYAQTQTVTGTVVSAEDDLPLPGVNVRIKGTTTGTVTDLDGLYSIQAEADQTLVFSYIGFDTQEAAIGNRNVVDVVLQLDSKTLGEVVVVGYGTQSRRDLTGSVGSVKGDDINRMPVASLDGAMQGRAAGVFVQSPSGTPGAGISMQIRGNTSLSASSQPLYVIDGIPIISEDLSGLFSGGQATNSLADINPADIESIEILKDASAAAIYGSRGANGVVLITTKRGKSGDAKIDINGFYGFQRITNEIDMHSSQEFLNLMNDAARQDNRALGTNYPENYVSDLWGFDPNDQDLQNTRWFQEIFRDAPIQSYDVAVSGGTDKTQYYTSLAYFNQEGVQLGTGFERISARLNVDTQAKKWLKVGTSMTLNRTIQDRTINDNSLYGVVINSLAGDPLMPVRQEDGSYSDPFDYFGWWMLDNPVLIAENYYRFTRTVRGLANTYAEAKLAEGLTLRSSLGIDYTYLEDEAYTPIISRESVNGNFNGFGNYGNTQDFTWIAENYLSYTKTIGGGLHNINAVLGNSYQASSRSFSSISAQGFPSDQFTKLAVAARVTAASTSGTNWGISSYFFRGNYNYADKLLATFTVRADGSSRFGENFRFGIFPSGSIAYRLSEEAFMKDQTVVSDLKVRASYGVVGNQDGIGNFASRGLFGVGAYRQIPSLVPTSLSNSNLTWESTTQANIGLDFGVLNDRITLTADAFVKTTDDLLLNRLVPGISGFKFVTENIGKVENRGLELAVRGVILTGPVEWSSSFNISWIRNKVLELEVDEQILNDSHILAIGHPIGTYFLIDQEGVDPETGDMRWVDVNGDGQINSADRRIVGNAQPKYFGGWDNSFRYKGFDLNVFFQFTVGNQIFNHSRASYENLGWSRIGTGFPLPDGNNHRLADERWMEPGDVTDIPRASLTNVNWREYSSRWLEDGSFLRLRMLTLGYNFNPAIMDRIGVRSLRVFAQAQNLLTFTRYTGFDPEVSQNARDPRVAGSDFGTFPQTRSISLGFNIGL
ncbi:SusC/RagA family TonB-linked outer membrane protein [Mongoliibacter ruber]|uniref:TonB-linked SusC/RagA family outer membrane protein n=1 Tax=Mongoliibacter ruber TaxID=1750599 RepID=A0A2T0WL99_9BACT|nr:TonB-dependent receptor [Mongoliibacter ruber]PRY87467.1 TonB-linked SusC/RagA family outer membrane protein [Mongoliibacter ruber]